MDKANPSLHNLSYSNFSIKVIKDEVFLNDTSLTNVEMIRNLRPYIAKLNSLIVQATVSDSTTAIRKLSRDQITDEIGKLLGVQTRVNAGQFEVYCPDTLTWKLVDSFSEQECSSCKKAKLIRQLSLMDISKDGRTNTPTVNL